MVSRTGKPSRMADMKVLLFYPNYIAEEARFRASKLVIAALAAAVVMEITSFPWDF